MIYFWRSPFHLIFITNSFYVINTMSRTSMLAKQVVKGISVLRTKPTEKNIANVRTILHICDVLHKGGRVKGYKSTDIPTDEKYEELKQSYESLTEPDSAVSQSVSSSNSSSPNSSSPNSHKRATAFGRMNEADKQLVVQMNIDGKIAEQHQRYVSKISKREALPKNYAKLDKPETQPILIMDGIELPKKIPTINEPVILMPKFDGCTIAIAFNPSTVLTAHTRGVDSTTGNKKINFVTDKMKHLLNPEKAFASLTRSATYLSCACKDMTKIGNNNKPTHVRIPTKQIIEIRIRAECVKCDKDTPDTATGFVAGGINGKLETFTSRLSNLCLRPFEVGLIKYHNMETDMITDIVPTQESALEILSKMNLLMFDPLYLDYLDDSFGFIDLLDSLQEKHKEPLDGIVYCPASWTYPYVTDESSKRVNYSKYKYKRNNSAQTKLLGISYSIGTTGKYTPTLEYEAVFINDKRYKQAKMAVKRIQDFGRIYVGQPCDVELKADINPMVVTVYDPEQTKEEITLITKCIHCHKKLEYKTNKTGDVIISCINPSCIGVLRQKIVKFLNAIKYKGISEKTLINDNITDINEVTFKKPIKPCLSSVSVTDIYIGCGICTVSTAAKVIPDRSLSIRHWNQIRDNLLHDYGNDPFVKQVVRFIDRNAG